MAKVNNKDELNNAQQEKEIEIKRNRSFQGELVIKDYLKLESLNLRDNKSISKVMLKNLPRLQECTIWNCGMKELIIENCFQLRTLNVRSNCLINLEFLANLENLDKLELDGNAELTEILKPYQGNWKACRLVEMAKQKPQRMLEILEFSQKKYSILKKTLASFSKEIQEQILEKEVSELNGEIKKAEIKTQELMGLKTEELMLSAKEDLKKLEKLKEEKEVELCELKKINLGLRAELEEAKVRVEEREKKIEELIKLVSEAKQKQISGTEHLVYGKMLSFLRAKSIFLNARQETIRELKKCFVTLESKFGKHDAIGEIGSAISNIGGTLDTLTFSIPKIAGEIIKVGNNFSKINLTTKGSKDFQVSLADESELSQLNQSYNSLIDTCSNEVIKILDLKDKTRTGKARLFNTNYEVFDILDNNGIWKERILTPEKMETAIILLSKNLKELETEWEEQFEKLKSELSKEHTSLFVQEQQVRTEIQQAQHQLEELINSAKNKLKSKKWSVEEREKRDKEREILLRKFLSNQVTLTTSEKELLERKLTREELDNVCKTQKKLTKLQTKLDELIKQEQQYQVHVQTYPNNKKS